MIREEMTSFVIRANAIAMIGGRIDSQPASTKGSMIKVPLKNFLLPLYHAFYSIKGQHRGIRANKRIYYTKKLMNSQWHFPKF